MLMEKVKTRLRDRAERTMSGRLDLLADEYRYPFPIYMNDNRLIVRNFIEAQQVFALVREELLARSVVKLDPVISAIDIPRSGRFRVWVEWNEIDSLGVRSAGSSAVFFYRDLPEGLQIDMIAVSQTSMADLRKKLAKVTLSA